MERKHATIAVCALTIILVGGIAWHLTDMIAAHRAIEARKDAVDYWVAAQPGLSEDLRVKYGVILYSNTGKPGSIWVAAADHERGIPDAALAAMEEELVRRKCPYPITLIAK